MSQLAEFKRAQSGMRGMKIRNKLMISYLVALIIPILIISLMIYKISATSLEEAAQQFASMYTSQAITTIDHFVDGYDQITKSVLVETDIIDFLNSDTPPKMEQMVHGKEVIHKFLMRVITLNPEIKTAMLISKHNELYQFGRTNSVVSESALMSQTWYMNMRGSKDNLFITTAHNRVYFDDITTEVVFTVGRKLLDYNGSYVGMILIDVDPENLINLNEDFLVTGNRYGIKLIIRNKQGGIVYHSDTITGEQSWEHVINQHSSLKNVNEDDLIVLSNKSNKGDLLLRTEIPLSKLLASNENIKDVTLFAIGLCVIVVMIVSIVFSFRITKPIEDLRSSMKQAETGKYVTIDRTQVENDEMGILVQSYNNMILKIKELVEHVYIAEIKQKQAKFLALQTQINPHMLYNTLESIRMKAVIDDHLEISDMIKILAKMFKLALRKDIEENLVRHEIEYAINYIELQNIRYDNRFILDVRLSEDILNTRMIPMIIQPILENSITHGFRDYNMFLNIIIEGRVSPDDQNVLIRIIDNGTELSIADASEVNRALQEVSNSKLERTGGYADDIDGGIGLKNIAERIKIHYGDHYYLTINVERGMGTVIEMLIPKQ